MKVKASTGACVIAFLTLARQTTASWRALCEMFAQAPMDPLVTPGLVAGHIHDIAGSLSFNADTIDPAAMASSPTSCDLVNDYSNYWAPSVSYNGVRLVPYMMGAYYVFDPKKIAQMKGALAFKQPLSMIVGRASGWLPSDDKFYQRIQFLARVGDNIDAVRDVPSDRQGFHTRIKDAREYIINYFFPDCWNGKAYSPTQSHVAYSNRQTGNCPRTHMIQFPAIRLEHKFVFDEPFGWDSLAEVPFTLSSGNETTAHADAVVMWDPDEIDALTAACPDNIPAQCFAGERQNVTSVRAQADSFWIPDEYVPGTRAPTPRPTPAPVKPTKMPSKSPTPRPTKAPSAHPTPKPTYKTSQPTLKPTKTPSKSPTPHPTKAPSAHPTPKPTYKTSKPTLKPTKAPSRRPTNRPTKTPSAKPSPKPTYTTHQPTRKPTRSPRT